MTYYHAGINDVIKYIYIKKNIISHGILYANESVDEISEKLKNIEGVDKVYKNSTEWVTALSMDKKQLNKMIILEGLLYGIIASIIG